MKKGHLFIYLLKAYTYSPVHRMSWNRVHMVLKHDGTKAWCVIITHPSQIIWQQATQIQSTPPQSLSQNCWCLKLLAYISSQDNTRETQIVPPGHVKKLSCQPQVNSHDASVLKACGDFQYTCFCWTTDVSFIVYTNRSNVFPSHVHHISLIQ